MPREFSSDGDPVVEWLLEASNPSVRFLTLTGVLGRSLRSKEVVAARSGIMRAGIVPEILERQAADGSWDKRDAFYTAKYRGTVWTLMILAEHYADGGDERVRRACEFILTNSQEAASGGFSTNERVRGGGVPCYVIPCLTGNMIWALVRLGYLEDPRVQQGIEWLTQYLRFDDGDSAPPRDFPYNRFEMCYGRHSCFMGVVKGLKALAEIPERCRSREVKRTIEAGVEFMLKHHVFKRSHNLNRMARPGWNRFAFPRMYQSDVLEIMLILRALGVRDERMKEAFTLIESKRGPDGRWLLEDSFNGKFQVRIEQVGKPSKWITLNALRVLESTE
jgi:hypothetical protein